MALTGTELPVTVEVPVPWLEAPMDGERNRLMFEALKAAVCSRTSAASFEDIAFRTETVPRTAPVGGYRLSYHSYGDSRHVWRVKETSVPFFYSFDRLGFSGWSEIALLPERFREHVQRVDTDAAREFCKDLRNWMISNNLSKYAQPDLSAAIPDRFVFFPLQVRGDIVAYHCRLDPLLVLRWAARMALHTRTPLVVKRHPFCRSRLVGIVLKFVSAMNPYVTVADAPIPHLLARCSSVITGNSGVGFEALIHGKQVFSFARSEYMLACHTVRRESDVRGAFLCEPVELSDDSMKFVSFFLNDMCFDARKDGSIHHMLDLAEHSAIHEMWCEQPRLFANP